jgi:hypothetical protein
MSGLFSLVFPFIKFLLVTVHLLLAQYQRWVAHLAILFLSVLTSLTEISYLSFFLSLPILFYMKILANYMLQKYLLLL